MGDRVEANGSTSDSFLRSLSGLGQALLGSLDGMEKALRHLHPPAISSLRKALAPGRLRLDRALAGFRAERAPPEAEKLAGQLVVAAECAAEALRLFVEPAEPAEAVSRMLAAMRSHCRAQEAIFPLRRALPPVDRFFLEPALHPRIEALDPERGETAAPSVGLHNANNDLEQRGGFSLYVPESYQPGEARPLIVALHGGSGHGRDFLWTWLREARGRRCLLLAPTARGSTWSLGGPDLDAAPLRSMVKFVMERWQVDPELVLLTGLSDGATYTILSGLQPNMPFTALAPVAGVLHPANFSNGNLARARGRRIYLVHGRLDWLFPIELARAAHEELRKSGADVTFREIEDLSHTYPREENARILSWFGADPDAP